MGVRVSSDLGKRRRRAQEPHLCCRQLSFNERYTRTFSDLRPFQSLLIVRGTEIRSERSLNFTLEELAPTFSKRGPSNKTVTESDVFASGSETFLNSIKFTVWDPEQKGSVGNGIGSFRPMKLETWNFLYDTVKRQTSSTRDELNKKWRIGVGVGVGVGVPLLMLGSFFLGKRQARKHERPNSPFK